jgi:hypothetical protein
MLYDSRFIESIPPAQSRERRPLVNLKAHSGWLLEVLGSGMTNCCQVVTRICSLDYERLTIQRIL